MFLFVALCLALCNAYTAAQGFTPSMTAESGTEDGAERWGYIDVREGAHMFWWLYYTYNTNGYLDTPWIIWLQGGPGTSSCGYGNFELIGPLDVDQNPREETWVKSATVLFIDNPVGTGYSYVDSNDTFTTDNQQIADDLVTMLSVFLQSYPDFQTMPLYIFGESYGGKMGLQLAQSLQLAVNRGEISVSLKGAANGNSWIGPVDTCLEWGPFLYYMGNLAEIGLQEVNRQSEVIKNTTEAGEWRQATDEWRTLNQVVFNYTNHIDLYNVLRYIPPDTRMASHGDPLNVYRLHAADDPLDSLMNGPIRDKLGIIPPDVTWGAQSDLVFEFLSTDFMKPVHDVVDDLLTNMNLQVIIYQGVLDVVCLTEGANRFVHTLTWPEMQNYFEAPRSWQADAEYQTQFFYKVYDRLKYYWVVNAGHLVPKDQPVNARLMLERILYNVDIYP